jgi:hypothetical protein
MPHARVAPAAGSGFDALVQAWTGGGGGAGLLPRSAAALAPAAPSASCSLLPDMYLGELSDAEQELIRDLRTAPAAAAGGLAAAQAAAAGVPPALHDFGGHGRGFSVLGAGDVTGDIFLGIGSLLGAEASWQVAPGAAGAGGAAGGERRFGNSRMGAPGGSAAPASFAGICDILRGGAPL